MRSLFSFSMLIAAICAAKMDNSTEMDNRRFLAYIADHGKDYKNVEELAIRRERFEISVEIVQNLNDFNEGRVVFEVNRFADWTQEEKEEMAKAGANAHRGVNEQNFHPDNQETAYDLSENEDDSYRHLQDIQTQHVCNWKDAGYVTEVRDHIWSCNATWAVAGVTVLESMHAIKNGISPINLSEQEALDCTPNSDCQGGWYAWYWEWAAQNGAQKYQNYPFDGTDYLGCRNQDNKESIVYPDPAAVANPYINAYNNPWNIYEHMTNGPLVANIYGMNDCWLFYKSGVLDSGATANCPYGWTERDGGDFGTYWGPVIDQQVVIVGYHSGDHSQQEIQRDITCRFANLEENDGGYCLDGWAMAPYDQVWDRMCCDYRPLDAPIDTDPYWIVQNSFGKDWGDNGLAKIKVELGWGVLGMNWAPSFMEIV